MTRVSRPRLVIVVGVAAVVILIATGLYDQYDMAVTVWLSDFYPQRHARIATMRALTRRSAMLTAATAVAAPSFARAEDGAIGDYGPAPEFAGISNWLNSPPLTMAGLRGKVVLIDFWTYSCINCLRTLPYVTRWYDTYKNRGLVVVGVHTPEFGSERVTANVKTATGRFGIHYPVAQDNAMDTWRAYSNQYWPAEYLVDRNGHVVLKHFGEGRYDETENAIRSLLAAGAPVPRDNGVDRS